MKTVFLFLFLTLASCTKDSSSQNPVSQLPSATTTGANTAGCYINGKLLIPKNGEQAIGGPALYGLTTGVGINFNAPIIGDDYRYINIKNFKDADGDEIYLHLNDMTQGLGNYTVGQSNGQYYTNSLPNNNIVVRKNINTTYETTYLSSSNSGIITFTRFDYQNGIYSGIFNCTLYNVDNPSQIIQVTDGRFDINVATLNH